MTGLIRRAMAAGLVGFMLAMMVVTAASQPLLDDCARLATDRQRLDCYDRAMPGQRPGSTAPDAAQSAPPMDAAELVDDADQLLSRIWELDPQTRRNRFQLVPHQNNYLLPARASSQPNRYPSSPDRPPADQAQSVDSTELKFQFSVKLKVAENLVGQNGDLWFGYTQQANWQVYNDGLSKPFRELNYSPEMILSLRADTDLLGWRWRLLNIGLLHESNGLSEPGSRSWNRLYTQFGFTRGRWVMMIRPWVELGSSDDNPDIIDYMGRGDLRLAWLGRRHSLSLLTRYSFAENRGAVQLDWAFPVVGSLKGYVQVFRGYGESLIDYNHAQTTVGIGVLLTSWQ